LGAMMRTVLIILGIFLQVFVAVSGFVIFVGWLLSLFIIITGFLFAFGY